MEHRSMAAFAAAEMMAAHDTRESPALAHANDVDLIGFALNSPTSTWSPGFISSFPPEPSLNSRRNSRPRPTPFSGGPSPACSAGPA